MLNIQFFENCCGMQEIGGFNGPYAELKAHIAGHLLALKTERELFAEEGDSDNDFLPGGLIATTTADQKTAVRALKFHKFRGVFTFTNPGTGHKVTLWAKKLVR